MPGFIARLKAYLMKLPVTMAIVFVNCGRVTDVYARSCGSFFSGRAIYVLLFQDVT